MSKPLQSLERPPRLSQWVQDAIRSYIIDNNLMPDEPLPAESELARQLGVSRTSVREAVKALESLGVLETRRGSGIYVRDFSFEPLLDNLYYGLMFNLDDLIEFLEIRRVLEIGMIEQVLPLATETQLGQLHDVLEKMRVRAESGEAFPEEDRLFHQVLFEELGSQMLLRVLDVFWLAFHSAVAHKELSDWDRNPVHTYRDHAAIVNAITAGDAKTARDALEQHYEGIIQRLALARRDLSEPMPATPAESERTPS